mgnify:CR=1 FL=1
MGFPDMGKKNKGGKKDLPTKLKTPKRAKKVMSIKKPQGQN